MPPLLIFQVVRLFCLCYYFTAILILTFPFALMAQLFEENFTTTEPCLFSLPARLHHFSSTRLYIVMESFKQILLGIIKLVQYKRVILKNFFLLYTYFYVWCIAYDTLLAQWWVFRVILLSGDVELNPGPETLNFCTWNLNSIAAHDFLRVSLLEAYNSVYSNDLIGIVETHLDNTVDEDRLSLHGYTFIKDNHPQNVKRGGVGLYIRDSLPSTNRPDLSTLPECVVCEIQINRRKYFFACCCL